MDWMKHLEPLLAQLSLDREVLGNTLLAWIVALAAVATVVVVLESAKRLVLKRVGTIDKESGDDFRLAWRGLAAATKFGFILVLAFYVASLLIVVPAKGQKAIQAVAAVAFLLQFGLWGNVVVRVLSHRWTRGRLRADPSGVMMTAFFTFVSRVVLWVIISLLVLENIGVEVTALITGLGIGGVAVALAAQNILGDLFASLSIIVDRPFLLGDFIIVGDLMGTVEHIGMKTTRVRALSGEQLVFPNSGLLQSKIRNYNRMEERRVLFSIGVTIETPREKVAAIPAMLREIVASRGQVRVDRAHLQAIGDSALQFEVVYFVLSSEYNLYMDIQQEVYLEILGRFEAEEIELAYPTKTLYVRQTGPLAFTTIGDSADGASQAEVQNGAAH